MAKLSRRKIAEFWATELEAGRDVTVTVAAYLVQARRTKEADLLVRETEAALAARGVVVADIISAHKLPAESVKTIREFLTARFAASRVALREHVDTSVLGGILVGAAGEELDATVRTRLNQLKASKI